MSDERRSPAEINNTSIQKEERKLVGFAVLGLGSIFTYRHMESDSKSGPLKLFVICR